MLTKYNIYAISFGFKSLKYSFIFSISFPFFFSKFEAFSTSNFLYVKASNLLRISLIIDNLISLFLTSFSFSFSFCSINLNNYLLTLHFKILYVKKIEIICL